MFVSEVESNLGESYSATLYSSTGAIRSLADESKELFFHRHDTLHPDFFLASVSEKHWKARAVAVTYNNRVVGILYAKERLLFGRPTGIVYSDIALGLNIIAEPVHSEQVLTVALRSLLSGSARALRVVLP